MLSVVRKRLLETRSMRIMAIALALVLGSAIFFVPQVLVLLMAAVFAGALLQHSLAKKIALLALGFWIFQDYIEFLSQSFAPSLTSLIRISDEIMTVMLFSLVLAAKCLRPKTVQLFRTEMDYPLFLFLFFCLISGVWNQNPIFVTGLGTFDLAGNFLFLYVFQAMAFSYKEAKLTIRIFYFILLFICAVAAVEVLLPYSTAEALGFGRTLVRFGLRRTGSLTGNPNNLANLIFPFLLFLFICKRKIPWQKTGLLILGTTFFLTSSRQYWGAFLIAVVFLWIFFNRQMPKARVFILFSIVFVGLIAVLLFNLGIGSMPTGSGAESRGEGYFRMYALLKSLSVLWDHLFFGVGPGRFGGFVASFFPSPIYSQYNFNFWEKDLTQIDMFWPQVWAECGLFGLALFLILVFGVFRILRNSFKTFQRSDPFLAELSLTGIGLLVGLLVASWSSPTFSSVTNSMFLFALSGLLVHFSKNRHATSMNQSTENLP